MKFLSEIEILWGMRLDIHVYDAHLGDMIEIIWGKPLHLVTKSGDTKILSTIEQAEYLLKNQWPDGVCDDARAVALSKMRDAMECIGSIGSARRAFVSAARVAGFRPESMAV